MQLRSAASAIAATLTVNQAANAAVNNVKNRAYPKRSTKSIGRPDALAFAQATAIIKSNAVKPQASPFGRTRLDLFRAQSKPCRRN